MTLGRCIRESIESRLAVHGIALRHLSALGHLSRDPGVSYSELARRAGVTPQSMQATLRTLEDSGAVRRETDAGRGRTARLSVTDAGRRLIAEGRSIVDDHDGILREHLSDSALAELVAVIPQLTAAVRSSGEDV